MPYGRFAMPDRRFSVPHGRFPVRADVLAKAALHKTKQFYYIPYTDFKYNISVYLDDILHH